MRRTQFSISNSVLFAFLLIVSTGRAFGQTSLELKATLTTGQDEDEKREDLHRKRLSGWHFSPFIGYGSNHSKYPQFMRNDRWLPRQARNGISKGIGISYTDLRGVTFGFIITDIVKNTGASDTETLSILYSRIKFYGLTLGGRFLLNQNPSAVISLQAGVGRGIQDFRVQRGLDEYQISARDLAFIFRPTLEVAVHPNIEAVFGGNLILGGTSGEYNLDYWKGPTSLSNRPAMGKTSMFYYDVSLGLNFVIH